MQAHEEPTAAARPLRGRPFDAITARSAPRSVLAVRCSRLRCPPRLWRLGRRAGANRVRENPDVRTRAREVPEPLRQSTHPSRPRHRSDSKEKRYRYSEPQGPPQLRAPPLVCSATPAFLLGRRHKTTPRELFLGNGGRKGGRDRHLSAPVPSAPRGPEVGSRVPGRTVLGSHCLAKAVNHPAIPIT
jgi:hypothetical protein